MILLHIHKEDKFIHPQIKYYIIEYDHTFGTEIDFQDNHKNNSHKEDVREQTEEEMLKYLEKIGFIHICYSKDDLPIFIYQKII
jgi:regulatory protein YycH of two-component signal transduction system YycFG